ncbi:MAG: hypothetical protein ABI970_12785 [Chloroflexota bacterium]
MAGGYKGASRRIDTSVWRLARLMPLSAADVREIAAAAQMALSQQRM